MLDTLCYLCSKSTPININIQIFYTAILITFKILFAALMVNLIECKILYLQLLNGVQCVCVMYITRRSPREKPVSKIKCFPTLERKIVNIQSKQNGFKYSAVKNIIFNDSLMCSLN